EGRLAVRRVLLPVGPRTSGIDREGRAAELVGELEPDWGTGVVGMDVAGPDHREPAVPVAQVQQPTFAATAAFPSLVLDDADVGGALVGRGASATPDPLLHPQAVAAVEVPRLHRGAGA